MMQVTLNRNFILVLITVILEAIVFLAAAVPLSQDTSIAQGRETRRSVDAFVAALTRQDEEAQ